MLKNITTCEASASPDKDVTKAHPPITSCKNTTDSQTMGTPVTPLEEESWMRRNLSIVSRIGLLLLFMIVFASCIGVTYSYYMGKVRDESLATAQSAMLEGYERTLRAAVQTLATTLGETVRLAQKNGQNPVPLLREAIQSVRYEDQGYYFIYDVSGRNIAHPFNPEFQGKQRLDVQDEKGTSYISLLSKKASQGGGFVTYWFNKPGKTLPSPKLGYAQLIPGTTYWLATGLYIDAIEAEQARMSSLFSNISQSAKLTVGIGVILVLILIVLPASLVMVNSILQPWRQMEKELRHAQKMEAIGIFAGGIAHDFNNILGAITSCSELALSDTPANSPVQEDLRHVLKAAKRGKNLVKRIKAFSQRTDSGRQTVRMKTVLKETLQLLQTFIPATIAVRTHINTESAQVKAAPDQLLQVIMNLCTNAEQAMRGMKGVLDISLDVVDLSADEARNTALPPGCYARLSVTDTGIGMKPVVLKRIFDPFYTTRKKTGGTGLGLSMSHSIVNMHGGTITVESTPNKGSTFRVFLPCALSQPDEEHPETIVSLPKGTETILVVDDDEDLGYSIQKLFTRLGYTVVRESHSQEALRLFKNTPEKFDLMLTDQMMPVMTGTELTREIHALRPELPVILYSGFEDDGLLPRLPRNWRKAGISAFFSKPFDTSELCRAIRRLLDER